MKKMRALISDVDNTLFDWVDLWYACFRAMTDEAARISGVPIDSIYDEARVVHQTHGTSEYAFLLEELPSLREVYGDKVVENMASAIEAFRDARRSSLRLYSGVMESLVSLKERGIVLVAYTESMSFYTRYRFRKLGLDKIFDYLYSPEDHALPNDVTERRFYSPDQYELANTVHKYTEKGELKPNPRILLEILSSVDVSPCQAVYIGDSLMKDVAMAQDANVLDVHAAYGQNHRSEAYELLRRVTHWSPEDVERERMINSRESVVPTVSLSEGFSPVIELFSK